jgi:hypothetical protein
MIKNGMKVIETKNEKVTVKYVHKVIEEHNAGDWYGRDYIFEVGGILRETKTPGKFKYYGATLAHGAGLDIPAEKVGVFRVTRTTVVTETEEAL